MKQQSILTLLLAFGLCAGTASAKGNREGKHRDTNGDGLISEVEFTTGAKNPERAKLRFEKADANHDGKLDQTEKATLKAHARKNGCKRGKKGGKEAGTDAA